METSVSIEHLLGEVFDRANEGLREELSRREYEARRHEFVFHMLDWRHQLEELAELVKNPDKSDAKSATKFIIGFLYHVVPHVKAAARLLECELSNDPFAPADDKPQE
jgi:hypothetical protein